MNTAVALTNIVLGIAYCGYGLMTMVEMNRDWDVLGFSHFGAAWIFMAFTCGPHHLFHGSHVALEGRVGGWLDLVAVVVGLPAGVIWLALRVEAFVGGRGDRFIPGSPRWVKILPVIGVVYTVALATAGVYVVVSHGGIADTESVTFANAALVGLYLAIAYFVGRTQIRNHGTSQGWSVSGLSLTIVFVTCALMHGVWGVYSLTGQYGHDVHGLVIDWLSVPAACYFLWVVRGLYKDSLRDWNTRATEPAPAPVLVPSRRP
ncbi:MAG: hypothetical protein JO086_06790 [Acidimicrobiia bacterium]|nr:hypothetical protein [Acidimicrobiia bacterium]